MLFYEPLTQHDTDSTRRPVSDCEAQVIRTSGIPDNSNQSPGPVSVTRWARLLLPNGQVARCAWKEKSGGERAVRCSRNVKVLLIWSMIASLPDGFFLQLTYGDKERFGEVYFFYRISVEGDQWMPVALISLYSIPDPDLLKISSNTLLACRYHGDASLVLVKAESIKSVVAMVPLMEKPEGGRPRCHKGRFFVVEKPGLSLVELGTEEGLEVSQA